MFVRRILGVRKKHAHLQRGRKFKKKDLCEEIKQATSGRVGVPQQVTGYRWEFEIGLLLGMCDIGRDCCLKNETEIAQPTCT